ncbi:hypothetical protein QBC46DRAFT_405814 [Diplogelasinospora grovesii]|uniref:Secreted protein n=1 Tax=Diplogelasinospora grovesii TaxID=303347 RepID=A0AAN6NC24_9PEZI|nr:hypothetical protein QBC46DRAFT_405814 [Diplogelasinospora grovesii]
MAAVCVLLCHLFPCQPVPPSCLRQQLSSLASSNRAGPSSLRVDHVDSHATAVNHLIISRRRQNIFQCMLRGRHPSPTVIRLKLPHQAEKARSICYSMQKHGRWLGPLECGFQTGTWNPPWRLRWLSISATSERLAPSRLISACVSAGRTLVIQA